MQLPLPLEPRRSESDADGVAVARAGVTAAALVRARRAPRTEAAERRLRLEALERPADELKVERALLGFLPPGKALSVKLTDNRYTMLAVKRAQAGYELRLHRMFVSAEPRMMRAIARYVVHNDRRASSLLGEYIEANQHVIRKQAQRTRRVILRTAGRVHDLQAIFDRLNATHFGGRLEARITWGPGMRRRPRRSIKMGSFAVEDRLIRIHPLLDHPSVPEYFVAWIVYHEMLHGKHEVIRKGGRRCFHTKAFAADERAYPDFERAHAWERANIDRLLGG